MKLKKVLSMLLAMLLIVCMTVSFAGCGKKVEVKAKIGLLVFDKDSTTNDMIAGYQESLNSRYQDGEIVYVEKNAQRDASRFAGMIQELVDEGVAAIAAFGDDAAQAAVGQNLSVPVFFVGVSDAQALNLTTTPEAPDKNATGSEVAVPADRLVDQTQKLVEVASVGIIYDSSSMIGTHSATLLGVAYSKIGAKFDVKGITSADEAAAAASELLDSHDAVVLTVDALVDSAAEAIIAAADAKGKPVFCLSNAQVEKGAVLGVSGDIRECGGLVGQYTYEALNGGAINKMPVINTVSGVQTYLNMGKAVQLGYTINDEFLNTASLINKVDLPAAEEPAEEAAE